MHRMIRASRSSQSADVVDDRKRADVVEQRVDGEVAAERILFRRAVGVVALNEVILGPPSSGWLARQRLPWLAPSSAAAAAASISGVSSDARHVPAERRDFDRLVAELHVRQPEAAADDPAVAKELLDLVRMRRGADVEILRPAVQQQVAHAPADQVRDVIVFVKPIQNFERVGVDVAARNCVFRTRNDGRLRHREEL